MFVRIQEVTEMKADGTSALVSDVGGRMGLWMGISAVSLTELMYCIGMVFCGTKFCHNKKTIDKIQKVHDLEISSTSA